MTAREDYEALGGYSYDKSRYKPKDSVTIEGLHGIGGPARTEPIHPNREVNYTPPGVWTHDNIKGTDDYNINPSNSKPIDAINQAVLNKVITRAIQGMKTYGVSMERTDVSTVEWLKHLQEELLDGAVYLERIIQDYSKK